MVVPVIVRTAFVVVEIVIIRAVAVTYCDVLLRNGIRYDIKFAIKNIDFDLHSE